MKFKDDRYDIARINEVGRRNTTEVSSDNRYTEETRRILEKLGSLATAIANHFGWEPELVMKDFVKDLAIINNPSLLAELDPNNPIDQMTDELMRMYLADEESINVLQNTALAQIMNMSEQRAIQTLESLIGRGQLGTTRANQFISNRNTRRIGHNDSTWTVINKDYFKEGSTMHPHWFWNMMWYDLKDYGYATKNVRGHIYTNCPIEKLENLNAKMNVVNGPKKLVEVCLKPDYKLTTIEEIGDSQSQEIAREYQRLNEKYDLDFNDLVYGEDGFMKTFYPDGFPDFYGDIIFSEKYWTEFEKWLKDTKDIELKHEDNYDFLADSKEDKERFIEKFGEDAFNRYNRIQQKLQGNYKDMTWLTANVEVNDLNEIFNNAEFKGYEPDAENDLFAMFNIRDLQMCQKLAEGANWCITTPTAYNLYVNTYGARFIFYINKKTGEKYCVARIGDMNEIADQNDRELAKLPEGVPGDELVSSVVREDMDSQDALVATALANIQLLPVDTLRIAYDDMFNEELDMLADEEVKEWLLNKLPEVNTNELKRYIEEHLNDFVVLQPEDETDEDELDYTEEDEETFEDSIDEEITFEEKINEFASSNESIEIDDITKEDENTYDVVFIVKFDNEDTIDTSIKDIEWMFNYDDEDRPYNPEVLDVEYDEEYLLDLIMDKYKLGNLDINGFKYELKSGKIIEVDDENLEVTEEYVPQSNVEPASKSREVSGSIEVAFECKFVK